MTTFTVTVTWPRKDAIIMRRAPRFADAHLTADACIWKRRGFTCKRFASNFAEGVVNELLDCGVQDGISVRVAAASFVMDVSTGRS